MRILPLALLLSLIVAGCRTGRDAEPRPRVVRFAGLEWEVKSSSVPVGPGPNFFSADLESVHLDRRGQLHLRIDNRSGLWRSAEVLSRDSFGYGRYTFEIECPVREIDANSLIGLFTWSDDPTENHREIDVEFSQWGEPGSDPGQFVVQPYDAPGNRFRFAIPVGVTRIRCSFHWKPDGIDFEAATLAPNGTTQERRLAAWNYRGPDTPQPGDEKVHINFWMNRGLAPAAADPMELIVRDFRFEPGR